MSFRPCIDLHNGVVKQIVGSTLASGGELKTNFVSAHTPAWFAELYRKDNLKGGHVIKLGPGCDDAAKEALAAWPGGLQLGGGVNADNAVQWIEAGAQKVIVTSFCFADGMFLTDRVKLLLSKVGKEHLVLDLSCRRRGGEYFVVTDRWSKFTALKVESQTLEMLSSFCSEFLIHAVDIEGKQAGIDEDLLELLSQFSPIDCVYAGGISSLNDVEVIQRAGHGKIHYTIGSALDIFGGRLAYSDVTALEKCRK